MLKPGKVIGMKGFTKEQLRELKELAKEEISFPVNMKQHTQKYATGAFQISPRSKRGKDGESSIIPQWTREEFKEILTFLLKYDIVVTCRDITSPIDDVKPAPDGTVFDMQYLLWSNYFSFMTRAVREIKLPEVINKPSILRSFGNLYLVEDEFEKLFYVTGQESWLFRSADKEEAEKQWLVYIDTYYPGMREAE
ncbi:hypothetical protein ACPV3A_16870 [Paenibacillus sp. Dod16]|uniref:hypothetical protein n=1 Tax=Paenibacillus sp. Dod16 TaxID=3416392 RepID=UPI003CF4B9C6